MSPITLDEGQPRLAPENLPAVPDYLANEGLEHADRAREHMEGVTHPGLRAVPLVIAVMAVLAGLSSLYGNRLAESMVTRANQAELAQTKAADIWTEYQANSLKAHLASDFGEIAKEAAAKKLFRDAEHLYRDRQKPLKVEAVRLEQERTDALARMDAAEGKKLDFDVGTALLEISIVLASVAVMTRRPLLFYIGLGGALVGIVYCVIGLVR